MADSRIKVLEAETIPIERFGINCLCYVRCVYVLVKKGKKRKKLIQYMLK
jgi:hypothetical protein